MSLHLEKIKNLKNAYLYCRKEYTSRGEKYEFELPPFMNLEDKVFDSYNKKIYEKKLVRDKIYRKIKKW